MAVQWLASVGHGSQVILPLAPSCARFPYCGWSGALCAGHRRRVNGVAAPAPRDTRGALSFPGRGNREQGTGDRGQGTTVVLTAPAVMSKRSDEPFPISHLN